MQIGAVPPVPRLLAVMAVKPDPFGSGEQQAANATHAASPAQQTPQPIANVQMLVTLAAIDPDRDRRRQQAERGHEGLDRLAALNAELIVGQPTPERLKQLADWVRQADAPEDPILAEIMAEIELRVRVELAKFDMEI